MIKSMTGYGAAKGSAGGYEFSIELKSVNNRYLDSSIRVPRNFLFAEEPMKTIIQEHISRGKVDVFVAIDSSKAHNVVVSVNEPVAEGYIKAVRGLSRRYDLENDLTALSLCRFPEVLQAEKRETDKEEIIDSLCGILREALSGFDGMRAREGEKTLGDIVEHLDSIEGLTNKVEERSPMTVDEYRQRLTQRMKEVLETVDIEEARILTEAAIFADKIAVNEETVRIKSHLSQFRELLQGASPVGRKLDFLIQELNREVNTIGSKANDTEISKHVVDMKAEIEKIREQVQNIE